MSAISEQEIIERIDSGRAKFLFDTNALFGDGRLIRLCTAIGRMCAHRPPVPLYVSATAHAEKLFDLKQAFKDRYDPSVIIKGLEGRG